MADDVPNLGETPADGAGRDAVHVAVVPLVAAVRMAPGCRFMLDGDGMACPYDGDDVAPLGIVDPFRESDVEAGGRFWGFLMPGTVTGIRHVWRHPAFRPKAPTMGGGDGGA